MMIQRSHDHAGVSGPRTGGADVALQLVQPKSSGEDPPAQDRLARLAVLVFVTVVEGLAIYLWLRWWEDHPWWGFGSLIVGEILETAVFRVLLPRKAQKRWGDIDKDAPGAGHFRKVQQITGWVGTLEIGIWLLWLTIAETYDPYVAAGVLFVLMHLKHQVEAMAFMDIPYRTQIFSFPAVLASAMETAGAAGCLALIQDGQPVWGAVVLALGLTIEHRIQGDSLGWEMTCRDIRVPRDRRWSRPPRLRESQLYAVTHFPRVWRLVQRVGRLERFANRFIINHALEVMEPRPNPLSTMAPYTSWASLTDRQYSGRHLPPECPKAAPPSVEAVAQLFKRSGDMVECPKSTALFMFFAQWFTDGFLRTNREGIAPGMVRDTLKNESTHEIDLSQLYGLNRAMTNQLRAHHGGLLKSQTINGEEYPPYLCRDGVPKKKFDKLLLPLGFDRLEPEVKNRLFAMGTDVTNIGIVAFHTLFLREHNRIARQLGSEHPGWDNDRVFETARNVLTVVLLKIVLEDYVNHITPNLFKFRLAPGSFRNPPWYRPNWMAVELNLLYRWHSLVPSTLRFSGKELKLEDTLWDTALLTKSGLGQFMTAASSQPAGRIGLFNTPEFLVSRAEVASITQARVANLCSYNDYRRLCGLPPVTKFSEISSDRKVQQELCSLYRTVDDVEFYVGLFAEQARPNGVLPPLLATMVSYDAFSQVLTNPLLAPRIFNEDTFTAEGMKIIEETKSISDIVHRNISCRPERYFVSLTRRDYKRI
jgi:prostaglandin-endoperoxide synthase 2